MTLIKDTTVHRLKVQALKLDCWVYIPALPLTEYVTLSKLFISFMTHVLLLKMVILRILSHKVVVRMKRVNIYKIPIKC